MPTIEEPQPLTPAAAGSDQLVDLTTLAQRLPADQPWPAAGGLDGDVGGKAVGLAWLHRCGMRVPDTWVVPVGARPDPQALAALPTGVRRWAVRSSAAAEDGTRHSFAGMFDTELGVARDDLAAAVTRVASSGASARVRSYHGATAAQVAVVLQPFVAPRAAGVWIGRGVDAGRLEWVTGAGDQLVSGAAVPHWEEWAGGGRRAGEAELRHGGQPVGRACLAVQAILGAEADLEFAVLDSGLVWLQCRPVTSGLHPYPTATTPVPDGALRGTGASGGAVTARAVVLRDVDDEAWAPGSVLVTEYTDPEWVPLMTEAAALVTVSGGALCHAAIIARELGVPCVTGVGGALDALRTGDLVRVDGDAGTIQLLGRSTPDGGQDGTTREGGQVEPTHEGGQDGRISADA